MSSIANIRRSNPREIRASFFFSLLARSFTYSGLLLPLFPTFPKSQLSVMRKSQFCPFNSSSAFCFFSSRWSKRSFSRPLPTPCFPLSIFHPPSICVSLTRTLSDLGLPLCIFDPFYVTHTRLAFVVLPVLSPVFFSCPSNRFLA